MWKLRFKTGFDLTERLRALHFWCLGQMCAQTLGVWCGCVGGFRFAERCLRDHCDPQVTSTSLEADSPMPQGQAQHALGAFSLLDPPWNHQK